MKFTVVGAGAMGLRFGVLLQEQGNEVDFVEGWQPHYDKMKEQGGVYVTREHQNKHLVPVNVYTPEEYQAMTTRNCNPLTSNIIRTQSKSRPMIIIGIKTLTGTFLIKITSIPDPYRGLTRH